MITYTCPKCSFSLDEADRAWDDAIKEGTCPRCGYRLTDFPPPRDESSTEVIRRAPSNKEVRERATSENGDIRSRANGSTGPLVRFSGTGFIINGQGHILTNYHVIEGASQLTASVNGRGVQLSVVATDRTNDLALLEMTGARPSAQALFRQEQHVRTGENVVVIGFPHGGTLSTEPTVTTGIISAPTGPADDTRMVQITASVHGGNSGGPLLDSSGSVIGVVNAKLNAIRFWEATGDIPQNINFAIVSNVVTGFLDAHGIQYKRSSSKAALATMDIAEKARGFTVMLEAVGNTLVGSDGMRGQEQGLTQPQGKVSDQFSRWQPSFSGFLKAIMWIAIVAFVVSLFPI